MKISSKVRCKLLQMINVPSATFHYPIFSSILYCKLYLTFYCRSAPCTKLLIRKTKVISIPVHGTHNKQVHLSICAYILLASTFSNSLFSLYVFAILSFLSLSPSFQCLALALSICNSLLLNRFRLRVFFLPFLQILQSDHELK